MNADSIDDQVWRARAAVAEQHPGLSATEVDRRARLAVAFPPSPTPGLASALGKHADANALGMGDSSLRMIVRGARRLPFAAAVAVVQYANRRAGQPLLALCDVVRSGDALPDDIPVRAPRFGEPSQAA